MMLRDGCDMSDAEVDEPVGKIALRRLCTLSVTLMAGDEMLLQSFDGFHAE